MSLNRKYSQKHILINPQLTPAYILKKQYNYVNMNQNNNFINIFKKSGDIHINNNKPNIFVVDMLNMDGGAYIYLQNLIDKYASNYNFLIAREMGSHGSHGIINITFNDDYFIKTCQDTNELKVFLNNTSYDFIFINSLATQSIKIQRIYFYTGQI